MGSGEMAWWFRAQFVLPEYLASIPSTHMVVHDQSLFQFQVIQCPWHKQAAHMHMICTGKAFAHIK